MSELQTAIVQSIGVLGAGAAMYVVWKQFASEGVALRIVALGFAGRALLSAILFWISWLGAPIGRSLQLGNGLWFYALDGKGYYLLVDRMLERGLAEIINPVHHYPAVLYVQLLAVSKLFFGSAVSVAILLNLLSFLGVALVVAKWSNRTGRQREATGALLCMSVLPSFVLWSTQPLKDTFLCFLIVLFVFLAALWMEALERGSISGVASIFVLLLIVTLAIRSVRWQFAVVLWLAFVPTALWWLVRLRRQASPRFLVILGAGLACLIAVSLTWGDGSFAGLLAKVVDAPRSTAEHVEFVRLSFEENYTPSTLIEPGPLIESLPHAEVLARGLMAFFPRFLADLAGLASAQGGRGLWWFAEVDTLMIDFFILWVGRMVWLDRPTRLRRAPVVIFLLLLFVGGLPMLYMVNNFGTLIRFRMMLVLPLVMLPLGLPAWDVRQPGEDLETRPRVGV